MATDPGRWGHSLGNLAELWLPVLDAAGPESVVEVGAYAGDVTGILLDWAKPRGAHIHSIDPDPQPALIRMAKEHPELDLIRKPSLDALPELAPAQAVIVDGDHNYYTVGQELALIAKWGGQLPLIVCHDVAWPHGRRDVYYDPERIPAEHRRPMSDGGFLFPGVAGLHDGGLPYRSVAPEEGGAANGVLTAIEDFAAGHDGVGLAIVPAFFGLAVLWPAAAQWAERVQTLLEPWSSSAMLERLEGNRVLHLAAREREAARAAWCQEQSASKDVFLRKLLQSKTFSLAIWLSRLRQGGEPAFSKDEVRELLGE
jgi:hypothetical protein